MQIIKTSLAMVMIVCFNQLLYLSKNYMHFFALSLLRHFIALSLLRYFIVLSLFCYLYCVIIIALSLLRYHYCIIIISLSFFTLSLLCCLICLKILYKRFIILFLMQQQDPSLLHYGRE